MLKDALVEYCAPTLAGLKTGSICTVKNGSKDINNEIRELNRCLTKKGLSLIPLRRTDGTTLVYLYRPDRLKRDLQAAEAKKILEKKGYPWQSPERSVVTLIRHLMTDKDFPHEIGLFLGYPPSDVAGFMKDSRKGVKCCGCWKAYGNECEAQRIFESYKRCTEIYCRERNRGKSLEKLIVDTRSRDALQVAM
ncbi:MAG: DUF3793 family protein [Lachnospiraceae bacterium]|nr:DUF3793 family protein [Lachnospiraceae bacterium]